MSWYNPEPMTAMKITKKYLEWVKQSLDVNDELPDESDLIYDRYLVFLDRGQMTTSLSTKEFFKHFRFVDVETPGRLASIQQVSNA